MAARSYHTPARRKTELANHADETFGCGDPLLELIRHYERQRAMFDASDETNPLDVRLGRIFDMLHARLCDETPECTTDEGAMAALLLVGHEMENTVQSDLADALLRAVALYAWRRSLDA